VDQSRDVLDPNKNIWDMISEGLDTIKLGEREVNSRAYVARFNFSGTDQQKKVGLLSAGNETAFTWPECSSQAPMFFS